MFRNYLKTVLRNLARRRVFAAINILGLSIGICVCLAIFLVTNYELSFDNFHPDGDRIYRVVATRTYTARENKAEFVPDPMAIAMRRGMTGLEKVSGFYIYYAKVTIPENGGDQHLFYMPRFGPGNSAVVIADPDYFSIFRYDWLMGNPAEALNEPLKGVLTESQARKYFGSAPLPDILGKLVIYNDSLRLTVSGIVKDWGKSSDLAAMAVSIFISCFGLFGLAAFTAVQWMKEISIRKVLGQVRAALPSCFQKMS